MQILPNRTILEVGQHSNGLSVDHLSLTHDHEHIASCTHDSVKFWPVEDIIQARIKSDPMLLREDTDDDDSEDEGSRKRRKRKRKIVVSKKQKSSADFFADL